MPLPLLVPVGVGLLALLAAGSAKAKRSETTALSSPTDAQLQRATDVATTGLAPWVGYSGKNWQQDSVKALASKDPAKIAEVAANMRLDGLISQADEMDRYAGTVTAKAAIVNASIAQTTAILTGKADADAYQQKVQAPLPADPDVVVVPTALATAAREYASYIRGKKKGTENKTTVMAYQRKLGMAPDGMYGAGDAVAMAAADVAPPAILYWPKSLAQGPDALAKVQTAIAVGKANRASKTSQADWQSSYDAQSKSFRGLYGVSAKPRKPAAADLTAIVKVKMDPALQSAIGSLLGQSMIAGEVGWFGSKIAKSVGKALKTVAKTSLKVATTPARSAYSVAKAVTKPKQTITNAVRVVKNLPKTATKSVKDAVKAAKNYKQTAKTIVNSPYVKVGAVGLAAICPPAGAAAFVALQGAQAGLAAADAAEANAKAATHLLALTGKTVDALHTGTPAAKTAAKKLIVNTYKTAKSGDASAKRGLQALAVASRTRANAITVAKAAKPPPSVSMSGILVSDAGKIVRGSYRAA